MGVIQFYEEQTKCNKNLSVPLSLQVSSHVAHQDSHLFRWPCNKLREEKVLENADLLKSGSINQETHK